jgi:hypothetical protein
VSPAEKLAWAIAGTAVLVITVGFFIRHLCRRVRPPESDLYDCIAYPEDGKRTIDRIREAGL